jgi:hypothetical protein
MADQQHGVIAILAEVLAPLGNDKRNQIIEWVQNEIKQRPLVSYCYDGIAQHEDGAAAVWELTKESPISAGFTIFAMFHWETQRAVAVYCFRASPAQGGTVIEFFRELVFDPKHVSGPVSPDALFEEWTAFMSPEDPGEGARINGAAG